MGRLATAKHERIAIAYHGSSTRSSTTMSTRKKRQVLATRARRPTRARIKKVSAVMRQLGGTSPTAPTLDHDARFEEVVALVEAARGRAYEAVNSELVSLYWQLGEHISRKIASAEWGDGVVEELATELARRYPGLRGFTRPNLFRMRQFYEAYRSNQKVSALLRQLPWTHHLIILGQAKPPETREFYILAAIRERWSTRELERQIRSGAVLRSAPSTKKVSDRLVRSMGTVDEFKNVYSLDFLGLPDGHSEADLHGALLRNLGRFSGSSASLVIFVIAETSAHPQVVRSSGIDLRGRCSATAARSPPTAPPRSRAACGASACR